MISFDFRNSQVDLESVADRISGYLEKIHTKKQGFYSVIDKRPIEIEKFAAEADYEDVVVLGIGGSALAAFCLEKTLGSNGPTLWVVDNVDPAFIASIEAKINLKKTLFLVISKSGKTIETRAQYSYFKNRIEEEGLSAEDHFVFVSGPDTGMESQFIIPDNVGGRFSALTPVGLLPAALMGLDTQAMLKGAQTMRDSFLSENFEENLPFQLAAVQFLANKPNVVMMPYCQRLEAFVEWWRQLLAESIGKENKGLTPIQALGVTDQHSQSQLYNEGPNDKFFIMIKVNNLGIDLPTHLEDLSFTELLHTEMEGTVQSFTKNGRPNMTINLELINEETLGALFMLFQGATAFLGEFYEINAFDQPGVELSKQITLKLLREL